MKNDYRFYLRRGATGNYFYRDGASVSTSADPVPVMSNVLWGAMNTTYTRHERYHGIFNKNNPDVLQFTGDAAFILRYIKNTFDVEGKVFITVEKLNKSTQDYEPLHTLKVELSKHSSDKYYFEAPIIQGGLAATVIANEDTVYELPLGDPLDGANETEFVLFDGVALQGRYNFESVAASGYLIDSGSVGQSIGVSYVDRDGDYDVAVTQSTPGGHIVPGGTFSDCWSEESIIDHDTVFSVALRFDGSTVLPIRNLITSTGDAKLQVYMDIWDNDTWTGAAIEHHLLWEDPAGFIAPGADSPTTYMPPTTWAWSFTVGQFAVLNFAVVAASGIAQMAVQLALEPTKIYAEFYFRPQYSFARSMRQNIAFRRFVKAMTDNLYGGVSDLLSTDNAGGVDGLYDMNPAAVKMLCGDSIRGIDTDIDGNGYNPVMKLTLKDFARDGFASMCAGIGVERDPHGVEILRYEHLRHFYDKDTVIADLGNNISNFRMTPYNLYRHNNIKYGYKDQDYDTLNGRYEFNSEVMYKTALTTKYTDADYTSPFRTDPYGIEQLRAQYTSKQTTDNTGDNDVFKVICENAYSIAFDRVCYALQRGQTIDAGIPDDLTGDLRSSLFNIGCSPKRQLSRMAAFLKSNYGWNLPIQELLFQTGKKNTQLVSTLANGTINESANVDLTLFTDRVQLELWKPWVFEFDAPAIPGLDAIMETTDKYGVIKFTVEDSRLPDGSVDLAGFVLEVPSESADGTPKSYKLLCSPDYEIPTQL